MSDKFMTSTITRLDNAMQCMQCKGRERERERERERPVNSGPDMKKKPSRNMGARKALLFFALNKAMEKKQE
jgi:hypothetical protein